MSEIDEYGVLEELPRHLLEEIERIEQGREAREIRLARSRRKKLNTRRRLEDWDDERRFRSEFDYLG